MDIHSYGERKLIMNKKLILILFLIFISVQASYSQTDPRDTINIKGLSYDDMVRIWGSLYKDNKISKTLGDQNAIKEVIIHGNAITTVLFNYGSICKPNYLGNIADLVWKGLGYGFEFGPLALGEVTTTNTDGTVDTFHVDDNSHILPSQGTYSPDGTQKWGWLPKDGYADPSQSAIATLNAPDNNHDGKPDSWPQRWYDPRIGKYVWPAFLGDQATAPDEEAYYVMDDYSNHQFPYYPFINDSSKQGMGLDCEVRIFQFNNSLAKDILFAVYAITNVSDKDLPKLYFGMHGDPHIGGYNDYSDDMAAFIPPSGPLADPYPQRARSMVYAWDYDFLGMGGIRPGYFGWKFLESPTNSTDGKDNDADGITDESPYNSAGTYIDGVKVPLTTGISNLAEYTAVYGAPKPRWSGDENGDWDPLHDDVGIDGIGPDSPNYPGPDYGEGDGKPSQAWYLDVNGNGKYDAGEPISDEKLPGYLWAGSEPNFGMRDVMESDQLGLTAFHAAQYTNSLPNVPKNYSLMWEWASSDSIDPNQTLLQQPGDNIFNFDTGPMKLEKEQTQRFSMAIIFGDNLDALVLNAETSQRILESSYRFAKPPDKPTLTAVPGNGRVTLYWDTKAEKSFDPFTRINDFEGYKLYRSRDYTFSDVYTITDGNGVPFLGQALFNPNTGKRAQWDLVDSLSGFFPVEYTGHAVKYYIGNNTGLVHQFVDSTVQNGVTYYYALVSYDMGSILFGIPPTECQSVISKDPITGKLIFDVNTAEVTPGPMASGIKNAQAGVDGVPQQVTGNSTGKVLAEVLNNLAVEDKLYKISFPDSLTFSVLDSTGITDNFTSNDTVFVSLSHPNIDTNSFQLFDSGNNLIDPSKYVLNSEFGRIRGVGNFLPKGEMLKAVYRYYPVYRSNDIKGEDANDSFDGMRVIVKNDPLELDTTNSGFINDDKTNLKYKLLFPPIAGNPKVQSRADWEIRFTGFDTTDSGQWLHPGDSASTNLTTLKVICPFNIVNVTTNQPAKYLVFVKLGTKQNSRWNLDQPIILRPQNATGATTCYEVDFLLPNSGIAPVYPKPGDVFAVKTLKPFQTGDTYLLRSVPAEYEAKTASSNLGNIYVVPNPYVAYSISENPSTFTDARGDRQLQFRNLPPKCTIRIYTITGELVQTIDKDDNTSMASWNLLSYEGERIAYGVYIYQVDAPGVGTRIGRFAVIK